MFRASAVTLAINTQTTLYRFPARPVSRAQTLRMRYTMHFRQDIRLGSATQCSVALALMPAVSRLIATLGRFAFRVTKAERSLSSALGCAVWSSGKLVFDSLYFELAVLLLEHQNRIQLSRR